MTNQDTGGFNADDLQKKFVLSLSSLFEGDFSIDWIVELTGLKASAIISILEEQARMGQILNVKPAIYAFELDSRQKWISRLGSDEKERLHRSIASILIREMPENDQKPIAVSNHLICINNHDWKDCQWLIRAGEIYTKKLRKNESMVCFRHVIDSLEHQQGKNQDKLYIQAAIDYSNCYLGISDPKHFIRILEEAKERAKRVQNKHIIPILEMHIAKYDHLMSNDVKSFQRFKKAFTAAATLGDPELDSESSTFKIQYYFWQGLFRDVINIYENTVPDVHRAPTGLVPTLAGITVGYCYTIVGQMTQGLGMLDTLHSVSMENGDSYLAADASCTIAIAMLSIARTEDALFYLKTSLKEAEASNHIRIKTLAKLLLSLVFAYKRDTKEFIKFFNRVTRTECDRQHHRHIDIFILEALWYAHEMEIELDTRWNLNSEIERICRLKDTFSKGVAFRYKALYSSCQGECYKKIISIFKKSLAYIKRSGHHIELVKTKIVIARYYLSNRKNKSAKAMLNKARCLLSSANEDLIPDDMKYLLEKGKNENFILRELFDLTSKRTVKAEENKLLQQIISIANRIIGAERGALLLLDETSGGETFKLIASKNITIEQIERPSFNTSLQMIKKVIEKGVGNIYEAEVEQNDLFLPQEVIRSSIAVPVLKEDEVIGVLYHDNRLLGNVFKPSYLEPLCFLAGLASLQMDRKNAYLQLAQAKRSQDEANSWHVMETELCANQDGLLGKSPTFLKTLSKINKVAKSDSSILLTGETGSGKNMIAKAIHNQSHRRNGPFVIVQCSSLAESLIASELFGHEKGAFTGAVSRSIGRFEMADGGTIFLDEIADLSEDIQARLLRVLQSKEFERVGGGKHIVTSDFRLIAATNKPIDQQVRIKKFREDLYYRINVYPIEVPPLRERREDIPLLVHHFLNLYNDKEKKFCYNISEQVMESLVQYHWPGNIRELENVIQRGIISSNGAIFKLPEFRRGLYGKIDQKDSVETFESNIRKNILEALRVSKGKIYGPGGAAEMLQINPSTLASRMKKLGVKKYEWADS